jgi:hypothetical protein
LTHGLHSGVARQESGIGNPSTLALGETAEGKTTRALAGLSEQERGHLVPLLRRVIENITADDGSR